MNLSLAALLVVAGFQARETSLPLGLVPDRVLFETKDGRVEGYPLKNDASSGKLALVAGHEIQEHPMESVLRSVDRRAGKLEDISSKALAGGLAHDDPMVRDHCLQLLLVGTGKLPSAFRGLLGHEEVDVVRRALQVLVRRPGGEFAGSIKPLLKHEEEMIRAMSLDAYVLGRPDELIPTCESALRREESPWVRHSVFRALGQSEDLAVVKLLLDQFPDASRTNRKVIVRSLQTLTGQNYGFEERYWHGWWNVYGKKLLEEQKAGRSSSS